MKTRFILHGGLADPSNHSNESFYKEILKDVPKSGTILLVFFASRVDDNSVRINLDTQRFKSFSDDETLSIEVANRKDFIKQISNADAIFMRGGSTEKLIKALKTYPDLKTSFRGKTVSGSSAGAYAISTLFSSHYENNTEKGLL